MCYIDIGKNRKQTSLYVHLKPSFKGSYRKVAAFVLEKNEEKKNDINTYAGLQCRRLPV